MKVCTCLVLFTIFAHTNLISGIKLKDIKSAYLRQDKVPGDTKHLNNVTNFITAKHNTSKHALRAQRTKTLTGFIVEAIKVLNTYGDTAFEDFFHILDSEMSNYNYRGNKFSELMKNDDSKQLLSSTFDMIREQPVSVTRDYMNAIADTIRDETNDDNFKELLDYVNTLYRNAGEKFQKVLIDLKHYRNSKSIRTHIRLQKLIRFAVRTILFDHYSGLDQETRQKLKEKMKAFWESQKKPTASVQFHNPLALKLGMNNVNVVEKFMNAYVGPQLLSKKTTKIRAKAKKSSRSEETSDEISQDKTLAAKTEKTEGSSEESEKQILNYTSTELLSGQSFDTSSNSIKKSQERYQHFNTQRYMTLYTEEITTTKKKKFILRADNTTKTRVQRQPTTKQIPKDILAKVLKENMKKSTRHRDPSETRHDVSVDSKKDSDGGLSVETNYQLRAKQYPGKKLVHGKRTVEPRIVANGKNAGIFNRDNMKPTYLLEPVIQTKISKHKHITPTPKTKQAQAKTRSQSRLSLKESSSKYLEPYVSIGRTQNKGLKKSKIEPHLPDEGYSKEKFADKNKNLKSPSRRSGNDSNIGNKIFNEYVISRLDAIEKELKELKQLRGVQIETINDTNDNDTNGNDPNDNNANDNNANDNDTIDKKDNSEEDTAKRSDTVPLSAVNNIQVTETVTVTDDTATNTTTTDEEETTSDGTSTVDPLDLENATFLNNVATTVAVAATTEYPDFEPSYYNNQAGFFDNVNEGLDLRI